MSRLIRIASSFGLLLVAACATRSRGGPIGTVRSAVTIVERVRNPSIDTARTLTIVVRAVDEPTHPLQEAVVVVAPAGTNLDAPNTLHASTDRDGQATIARLTDGPHDVLVRRVGYQRFPSTIDRRPRCHEVLEVYLAMAPNCLVECTVTPARAVLTTCRGPA